MNNYTVCDVCNVCKSSTNSPNYWCFNFKTPILIHPCNTKHEHREWISNSWYILFHVISLLTSQDSSRVTGCSHSSCILSCLSSCILQISLLVKNKLDGKQFEKFRLYIDELDKMMHLLLLLSDRLVRTESQIAKLTSAADSNPAFHVCSFF